MPAKAKFSTPKEEEFTLGHRVLLAGSIMGLAVAGLAAIGLPTTLVYRLGRRALRRKLPA